MHPKPNSVMMFAAGFGTRMRPLTKDCPKPLIPVAGRPLIDRTLDLVYRINPHKIVVNLHYLAGMLQSHLEGTEVLLSHEYPIILDTGGGLRNALPLLASNPVYTTNTDAIWSGVNPFQLALNNWDPNKMDALVICVPPERAIGHSGLGDFLITRDGQISRGAGMIYGGVQIIKTGGLCQISDTVFSLNKIWDEMIKRNRLFGVAYPGNWCDVGSPKGVQDAEHMLRETNV